VRPSSDAPGVTASPREAKAEQASSPGFAEAIFGGPDDPHPRGIARVGDTSAITSVSPNTVEAVLPTHATLLGALLTILFSFGSEAQEEHSPAPHTWQQ
jgi:hypothetical protein